MAAAAAGAFSYWMWLCGLLGMIIKFAEATLAVACRTKNAAGEIVGELYELEL